MGVVIFGGIKELDVVGGEALEKFIGVGSGDNDEGSVGELGEVGLEEVEVELVFEGKESSGSG